MCGIVGIIGQNPVNESIYAALTLLQWLGQRHFQTRTYVTLTRQCRHGARTLSDSGQF